MQPTTVGVRMSESREHVKNLERVALVGPVWCELLTREAGELLP